MKIKNYIILFVILKLVLADLMFGQNLVPNGDFEQYVACPTGVGQVDSLLNWFNPCSPPYSVFGTGSGSPDYYSVCGLPPIVSVPTNFTGFQSPHSGDGYIGMVVWYGELIVFREYIEVQLTGTLISKKCYHFEMYVNLSNNSGYSIDTLGVYFSDTIVAGLHSHDPLPFIPQIKNTNGFISDTSNWTLISADYTASGGENFLIIGNFDDNVHTDTLDVDPIGYGYSYYNIDDVSLAVCDNSGITNFSADEEIEIFNNSLTGELHITVHNNNTTELNLYDITSRKLLQNSFTSTSSISTNQLASGIYIYELRNKRRLIKKGKIIIE